MRLRIDELSARTGVTSRNIRAYREKGLLPAPELEGRTGFYTEEHLQRLEIIEDLQERGFSLEAIRQTLEAWSVGGDFSHLLGLQSLLNSPFHDEEPAYETVPQLLSRFPDALSHPGLIGRAVELGLLEEHDSSTMRIPSPLLVEAGSELVALGVPLSELLDLVERIKADMADVATVVISLVERNLADPERMRRTGAKEARQILDRLHRLRPLAIEVIRPILAQALSAEVDQAARRLAEAFEADLAPADDAADDEGGQTGP